VCLTAFALAPALRIFLLVPADGGGKRQVIDGIVLTKFDTIDDKVGAALSMVYASGAPVMFVGCGQTYRDLMRLNVRSVVRSLLK
jgi:signal recognition particle receptor subunit alpha